MEGVKFPLKLWSFLKNILRGKESLRDKYDYCNNSIKVTITREEIKVNKISEFVF